MFAIVGVFAHGETLTVATYNVENYTLADRMVEGVYRQNYPKPEAEKQALRAVIHGLKADVLAIEEMGPRPFLTELQHDLKAEGLDYPFGEVLEAADPDRHVAVLSRRKFSTVRGHVDLVHAYFGVKENVKRGLLEVRLATEAGELTFFIVHLKSRITERPDDPESALRRVGEATAVRDEILRTFPAPEQARFIVLGDCNDSRASKTLRFLTRRGKTELAEILPSADGHGEQWTHFYRKETVYSQIDHICVSALLKPAVVGGAARIYDAPETAIASDHRPLVVTLRLERPEAGNQEARNPGGTDPGPISWLRD